MSFFIPFLSVLPFITLSGQETHITDFMSCTACEMITLPEKKFGIGFFLEQVHFAVGIVSFLYNRINCKPGTYF